MANLITWFWTMKLSDRLVTLRKQQGLSQQAMADAMGLHVNQIKRYEAGTAQPSLDGLKKLAVALHVTTDSLLFEESERGPDEGFLLQFEAVRQFDDEEKNVVRSLIDGMILKHQARRLLQPDPPSANQARSAKGASTPQEGAQHEQR